MPLYTLDSRFLCVAGIAQALAEAKADSGKLLSVPGIAQKKIEAIQRAVKDIYFESMDERAIQASLGSEAAPFYPDYCSLQKALRIILASEPNLDAMIRDIKPLTTSEDWLPSDGMLLDNYSRLDQQHGYFQGADPKGAVVLRSEFKELVSVCRKITVLVEKNNTSDDTMAYDYAYKLMALFTDPAAPDFSRIVSLTKGLIASINTDRLHPFHEALLVRLEGLPRADKITDRLGWQGLIQKL